MNFCYITPVTGLRQFATRSKSHLVLAQNLYQKEYNNFYQQRRLAGAHIILDNGAYEQTKPLDGAAYVNCIAELRPNVAVLPDILGAPWRESISASLTFLDEFKFQLAKVAPRTTFMFVPQNENPNESIAIRSALTAVNDSRVGHLITWVGLPRRLAVNSNSAALRANIILALKQIEPHLKFHALGMMAGNLEELHMLKEVGCDSIDSSAPVWRGWNGYGLNEEDNQRWQEKGTPCNFWTLLPSNEAIKQIETNIEVVNGICNI